MKKIFSLPLVAAVLSLGVLSSCGAGDSNKKAEETANAFYKDLQSKSYDSALSLLSPHAFDESPKSAWTKMFRRNAGLLGELKSYTKTSGFNIATSTSQGTTVSVAYDVQWQYGSSKDSVYLVKDKDGNMQVYRYTWLHSNASYMTEMNESEKQADKYMSAIKAGDFGAAIGLCSDEALKATPKENWAAFLQQANSKYGPMDGYTIKKDSTSYSIASQGQAGLGNYYDVFIESNRGDNKVMEKVVFFQKNYEEPIKLAGHYFL